MITDHKNRQIHVEKPFQRIISLYGAHTENLFCLGLEKSIIGVSVNDTYPPQVSKKQRFSYHDGPEKFLAHQPDLILIRPMIDNSYPHLIQRLEKSGIAIVSLQPSGIDEMYDYWRTLGVLTGKKEIAENMIAEFKLDIKQIRNLTSGIKKKKVVYFESIHTRMKTFSAGAMPIFALQVAGGLNSADDALPSRNTNIANYGKERILAKADKIDVYIAQIGAMNMVTIQQIISEPGFQIIKAIKNRQVYIVDENIISRPVPRLIEGILEIGSFLYPDIFSQYQTIKEPS